MIKLNYVNGWGISWYWMLGFRATYCLHWSRCILTNTLSSRRKLRRDSRGRPQSGLHGDVIHKCFAFSSHSPLALLQPDATIVAAEEQTRYDDELRDRQRTKFEQLEKARVRHNHAVHKEQTKNVLVLQTLSWWRFCCVLMTSYLFL